MAATELPVELWHRIASYCRKPDLRALRLTCSGIGAVVEEWFMRDLTIFFVREDFELVEALVRNPRVANNVRVVHFQADMLPRTADYKHWDFLRKKLIETTMRPSASLYNNEEAEELFRTSRGRRRINLERKRRVAHETRKHSKTCLKAAHQHYLELHHDQIQLMKENRAKLCLRRIFQACPKLESVFVILRDDASPETRCWRASKPFLATMIEPYGDTLTHMIGVKPVTETMLAALEAAKKLQELEMSPISYQFFLQPAPVMEKLYQVVSGIEKLRITINDDFDTDSGALIGVPEEDIHDVVQQNLLNGSSAEAARRVLTSFHDGRLVKFLVHAESLQHLNIVPPGEVPWWPGQIQLRDIVGNVTWPNLRTLGLCNFACKASDLTDLLLRHSSTLNELGLGHIDFLEGSWRDCLESFAGKLPHLREADLHGSFRDSSSLEGPLRLSCYCGEDMEYGPHVLCNFTRLINKYVVGGGEFPVAPKPSFHDVVVQEDGNDEDESTVNVGESTYGTFHT